MKSISIIILSVSFILISCKSKQALVAKLPPQSISLQTYALKDIEISPILLVENTAFFWKKQGQMTSDQVRDTQLLAKEYDDLESQQGHLEDQLKSHQNDFEIALANLTSEQKLNWDNSKKALQIISECKLVLEKPEEYYTDLTNKFKLKNVAIDKKIKAIEKELQTKQEIIEKTDEDLKAIKDLEEKKASFIKKKEDTKTEYDAIYNERQECPNKVTQAQNEYDSYQIETSESYQKLKASETLIKSEQERIPNVRKEMADRQKSIIERIENNVEFLEKPKALTLKVSNGVVQVRLNWKINPSCSTCPDTYSTEDSTIQNVTYQEEGGVLHFELKFEESLYVFRLVRAPDDQYGHIFYNGDLTVTNTQGEIRYGVLKFLSGKF
jgi:hypothetical protein